MPRSRHALLALIGGGLLCSAGLTAGADEKPAEVGWIRLFDGHSLDGWIPKLKGQPLGQDPLHTFRVEDGVLKVVYDQYQEFDNRFGHLFYHQPFSHYRLRLEYRFVGDQVPGGPGWALRNSGIMLHCQPPETMRVDQDFPVSIECQLLGGDGTHERPTANVCTPGTNVVMNGELVTRHCTNSTSPTFHGDQWVTVEVEVHGDGVIRHFVNGEKVFEYEQPQLDPGDRDAQALIQDGDKPLHGGYISLQSESHPCEFRRIELLALSE